jgi:hypothetical protein
MTRFIQDLRDSIMGKFFDPFHVYGGDSVDPSYQAVLDYATTQGYTLPSAEVQGYDNQQIVDLKAAGIWNLLDVFYQYATDGNSDFACINWKNPGSFSCLKVNSPTFTSLEGFTGNGSTSYLDTQYNFLSSSVNFQRDLASVGAYTRTALVDNNNKPLIGSLADFNVYLNADLSGGTIFARLNDTSSGNIATKNRGLFHLNRANSSNVTVYNNGVGVTGAKTSLAVSSTNLLFLRSSTAYGNIQISTGFVGGDLSAKKDDLFTIVEARMDAIGKGVVA